MSIVVRTWNDKESLSYEDGVLTLNRLGKTRIIPLSQVVSFDVQDPKGKLRPGTITIRLSGAPSLEDVIYSMFNVSGGNGITFPHGYAYLSAAREMQKQIAAYSSAKPETDDQGPPPDADDLSSQLRALKSLMDDGIITEEEFAEKKRQLLGI